MCEPYLEKMHLSQDSEPRSGLGAPKTPEPQIKTEISPISRSNILSPRAYTKLSSEPVPVVNFANETDSQDLERSKNFTSRSTEEELVPEYSHTNPLSPGNMETTESSESAFIQEEDISKSEPADSPSPLMESAQVLQVPTSKGMESPRRSTRRSTRQPSKLRLSITAEELALQPSCQEQEEVTPAARTLRKRKLQKELPSDNELWRLLTDEERHSWEGWAEITSEPALFNHILKGHGVKDVKIKELLGFDEELTRYLPDTVHGVIFLFKYREAEDETAAVLKCPPNIWFANQIADNSCASVAMLNILMNSQDIELGQVLSDFKASTMNKKPPWRGFDLANNAAIRVVHNAFLRRVEVLNTDLALEQDFEKWEKTKKSKASAKKRKVIPKKKTAKQLQQEDDDAAFHYIAYVPVDGQVWRMDGMQKNPVNLGEYTGNWLSLARENVSIQMAMHPDDEEYNFLAVCRAPLSTIRTSLASNAHTIQLIEHRLDTLTPDWRLFISQPSPPLSPSHNPSIHYQPPSLRTQSNPNTPSPPRELLDSYSLTPEIISSSLIDPKITHKLSIFTSASDTQGLVSLRESAIATEKRLQNEHCEEVLEDADEAETAAMYQVDYGPAMYMMVQGMLDSGELAKIWGKVGK